MFEEDDTVISEEEASRILDNFIEKLHKFADEHPEMFIELSEIESPS